MAAHSIVILATPHVVPFDLVTPVQVFRQAPAGLYRIRVCAAEPGLMFDEHGLQVAVTHGLALLRGADTVIVPGLYRWDPPAPAAALRALRRAHARGARIASICTGAFTLAQAGLLVGRRATTHWAHAQELGAAYPDIDVDASVLYQRDGTLTTSAGVTAGIDMCLSLIRDDHGQALANQVARQLVASPHRGGGQAQFIRRPLPPERSRPLDRTRQWLLEHLDEPVQVADMARHAGLAPRSFARRFEAEMGITPLQWLIEQRLEHAKLLLETTALPIELVAARSGFGTALSLREHFKRGTRTTPAAYRRTFARASAGD